MMIGRTEEIKILERAKQDPKSAFVAVYGRRRIGKTFLIRRVFEGQLNRHCEYQSATTID